MPSYTVYCSRVDAKTFEWASMIPLSHVSFVQCEQVKSRPEKSVEIKVSYSAVAIGTLGAVEGGGGGGGGRQRILGVANGKWNPSLSFPCLMLS